MVNVREIILNILIEYDRDGSRKPSLLKDTLEKYDYLETRDKSFIKRVTEGCLERNIQIDYILDSFSKTPTSKMQPFIRSLMRMSCYQIMFMDSVPDSAACNEAVKIAGKHKFTGLKGFVNGVLRNISRNKDKIQYPDKAEEGGIRYLSVMYSMPEWLCEMWVARYGFDKTEGMLKFFLNPRPTTVRVTKGLPQSKDVEEVVKELTDAGISVTVNSLLPYALELEKTDNIRYAPGFKEGEYIIQDVSSMLVMEIAAPLNRQIVVDVCAAPGGKSMHAAELVFPDGKVFSRDVSERKIELIEENAERLGLSNINTKVHDARLHDEELKNVADVLLLDLPCSGLGILGRKNDIKHSIKRQSLEELSKLQWEIIKSSWDYVKVGGTLIYSTCTVNSQENEEMVKRICDELPFQMVDITDNLPEPLKKSAKNGYIQLIPGEFGTDGFFIAKMKRI